MERDGGRENWKMDTENKGEEGEKELIHFKFPNNWSNGALFSRFRWDSVLFFCSVFETKLHVAQDSLELTMELGLTPASPPPRAGVTAVGQYI